MEKIIVHKKLDKKLFNVNEQLVTYKRALSLHNENQVNREAVLARWTTHHKVGETYRLDYAAPGFGYEEWLITRIDSNGDAYGNLTVDKGYIADIEDER